MRYIGRSAAALRLRLRDGLPLRFQGKIDEAVKLSEEMVAAVRMALSPDDWQLGWQLAVRGRVLLEANQPHKAGPILREALDILTSAMGEEHRRTQVARDGLVRAQQAIAHAR